MMNVSAVLNTSELSVHVYNPNHQLPADTCALQHYSYNNVAIQQIQCQYVIDSNCYVTIGVQELQITTTALYARELMVLKSYLPEGIVINSGGVRGLKRDLYKRMHLHGMASLFLDWKYKSYT